MLSKCYLIVKFKVKPCCLKVYIKVRLYIRTLNKQTL